MHSIMHTALDSLHQWVISMFIKYLLKEQKKIIWRFFDKLKMVQLDGTSIVLSMAICLAEMQLNSPYGGNLGKGKRRGEGGREEVGETGNEVIGGITQ